MAKYPDRPRFGAMPTRTVVQAFDLISRQYDDTRDAVDPATVRAIAACLNGYGVRSVLEVGVGTGRFSGPLAAVGLHMTGVDASRGMIGRARSKGLDRLVVATAYRLPFAPHSFDVAFFAHVLHLLDDPVAAIREGCRVGRIGSVGFVRPSEEPSSGEFEASTPDPRKIVYRELTALGYPVSTDGGGPGRRERELVERYPPDRLVVVCDRVVTEPLARRIDMLERGASRHTLDIPLEILRRAGEAARREVGDRTVSFRRIEALAFWGAALAGVPVQGNDAYG